jgi:hypothetical protein
MADDAIVRNFEPVLGFRGGRSDAQPCLNDSTPSFLCKIVYRRRVMHRDHQIWQLSMVYDDASRRLPEGDPDRIFLEQIVRALGRAERPSSMAIGRASRSASR